MEQKFGISSTKLLENAGYGSIQQNPHRTQLNQYLKAQNELELVKNAINTGEFIIDENATEKEIKNAYSLLRKRKSDLQSDIAGGLTAEDAKYLLEDTKNALNAVTIEQCVPAHLRSRYQNEIDDAIGITKTVYINILICILVDV